MDPAAYKYSVKKMPKSRDLKRFKTFCLSSADAKDDDFFRADGKESSLSKDGLDAISKEAFFFLKLTNLAFLSGLSIMFPNTERQQG